MSRGYTGQSGKVIPDGVHNWSLELGDDYKLKLFGKAGEQGEWCVWRAD